MSTQLSNASESDSSLEPAFIVGHFVLIQLGNVGDDCSRLLAM